MRNKKGFRAGPWKFMGFGALGLSLFGWFALGLVTPVTAEQGPGCPKGAEKFLYAAEAAVEPVVRENLIRKAIQVCPNETKAYYLLGRHYQALHMRSRALGAYRNALTRLPFAADILREIGKLNPRNPKDAVWNVVGLLIPPGDRGASQPPEEMSLEGLMRKVPIDPEARLALAKELTSIGTERMRSNQPGGPRMFMRALELVPSYERARTILVQHFLELGEYHFRGEWFDKAVTQYQKALVYAPDDPRLHLRVAEAYSRLKGHEKDALRQFRKADTLFAQRAIPMAEEERASLRERIQWGLDKFDENRPAYRNARSAEAQERGKAFLDKADYLKAAVAFKEAVGWTPGDALLHFDLAIALKQLADPRYRPEAIQHFERALALFQTNPPPQMAKLSMRFQQRIRMELDHLTGRSNSLYYVMQQVAIGVQERAMELSLFILVFAGIVAYLLRAGLGLSSAEPGGSYPI
ncbi:MAG: hypothetical protein ACE5JS_01615 [Nitrospinota bacterium]